MLPRGLAFLLSLAVFGQDFAPPKIGETTVVVFLSAVCPVSTSYSPRLADLYQEYTAKGVRFLFLNANQNEALASGSAFPIYKDAGNVMADRLGAQLTPESFVIDRDGKVPYHGRIDDAQNPARVKQSSLRLAIDAVLAGGQVAIPETKAFGCTIKRERRKLLSVDETGYRGILQANAGAVTLVSFWATWCAPCRQEMPLLAKLESRLGGFRLVTISADDPEQESAAIAFLQKSGISGTSYLRRVKDEDVFIRSVDPKWSGALPALFLYNRKGTLVKSFLGETDWPALEAAIRGAGLRPAKSPSSATFFQRP